MQKNVRLWNFCINIFIPGIRFDKLICLGMWRGRIWLKLHFNCSLRRPWPPNNQLFFRKHELQGHNVRWVWNHILLKLCDFIQNTFVLCYRIKRFSVQASNSLNINEKREKSECTLHFKMNAHNFLIIFPFLLLPKWPLSWYVSLE